MVNFPSKILSLRKSALFSMLEIKKFLLQRNYDVWELYNIMKNSMSLTDYIDILVYLYAINEIIIENKTIKLKTYA